MLKVNEIIQFAGLPYIVTEVKTDYDPYLQYCKHYKAKCFINGSETGGAITEFKNPYFDVKGVLNGTKQSKYA